MPNSGSQVFLCDMPIRIDSYGGCSHRCSYCFVQRKRDNRIVVYEGVQALKNYIAGKRALETNWCDWDLPLHWGGMSDPFQHIEKKVKLSLAFLEIFAETKFPFAYSTKSILQTQTPYINLLNQCNAVAQVSMVSEQYDKLEPGAPTFKERMASLEIQAQNTRRINVRIQPYSLGLLTDVLSALPIYKDKGVHGVIIEGMKRVKKAPRMVKVGGDYCYPAERLRMDFEVIKDKCHELGLRFYCAENRLRAMSDEACCCGVENLEGFNVNIANMNHIDEHGEIEYTELMQKPKTGGPFAALAQTAIAGKEVRRSSYKECMEIVIRTEFAHRVMGLVPETVPED